MTSLLADHQIKALCTQTDNPIIYPFVDHQVREIERRKIVSYGLSSYGYDVRLANEFYFIRPHRLGDTLDPHEPQDDMWLRVTRSDSVCVIQPHTVVLARTLEYIRMPVNTMALCVGKSTYARLGLIVNVTPLEAGWHGHVTLELSNTNSVPIRVYAGEGIAQFVFFTGDKPTITYADRNGKYQGQTGVTLAKL